MHSSIRFVAYTIFIMNAIIYVYSGNQTNSGSEEKHHNVDKSNVHAPRFFPPLNNTWISVEGKNISVFPFNISIAELQSACWPNITRTFWDTMIYHDKNISSKNFGSMRTRFHQLSNMAVHQILQLTAIVNELSNLQDDYIVKGKGNINMEDETTKSPDEGISPMKRDETSQKGLPVIKDNRINEDNRNKYNIPGNNIGNEVEEEDSFLRSITVPVLLIIILMLFTYIAFLYRKLQFARYKDAHLLVEDQLMDP